MLHNNKKAPRIAASTQGNMAIVLVEQKFDFAYGLADRFVVMTRGEVKRRAGKADVTPAQMLEELAL